MLRIMLWSEAGRDEGGNVEGIWSLRISGKYIVS